MHARMHASMNHDTTQETTSSLNTDTGHAGLTYHALLFVVGDTLKHLFAHLFFVFFLSPPPLFGFDLGLGLPLGIGGLRRLATNGKEKGEKLLGGIDGGESVG